MKNSLRDAGYAKVAFAVGTLLLLAVFGAPMRSQTQVIESPQSQISTVQTTEAKSFDAVSIKRSDGADGRMFVQFQAGGRLVTTNFPLRNLITLAYQLPLSAGRSAIVGAPDWIDSERYNIQTNAEGNPSHDQVLSMIQSMLGDRFKLAVHWETRQLPVYALVVSKPGKLIAHAEDNSTCRDLRAQPLAPPQPGVRPSPVPIPCGGGFLISPGRLTTSTTMQGFAKNISWFQQIDRSVVDRTGLSGTFDIVLDYAPFVPGVPLGPDASAPDPSAVSIFTALQEQLGLKLESETGPVNILVIDHVEKPSEN